MPSSTDRKTNHSPNTSLTSSSVHPNGGPSSTPGSRKKNRRQQSPGFKTRATLLRIPPPIRRIDRAKTRVLEHRAKRAGPFLWRRKNTPHHIPLGPGLRKTIRLCHGSRCDIHADNIDPGRSDRPNIMSRPKPGNHHRPRKFVVREPLHQSRMRNAAIPGGIAGPMSLLPGTHRRIHRLPSGTPY